MHNNLESLGLVSKEWQSEFEGILLIKDKKSNYSEHWSKLKGNILIFCKSADFTCVELFGVVVLECFTLEVNEDSDFPHSLKLKFGAGDPPLILVAKSKEEYTSWKHHIAEARCNSFSQRLYPLKLEILQLKKLIIDTDTIEGIENFVEEGFMTGYSPSLEITLSCQNIPYHPKSGFPNSSVAVLLCNSLTKEAKLHSLTDVVQNNFNPQFRKIIFIPERFYETNIFVKFIVFNIRDIGSYTRYKIGQVEIFINTLLNNSNLMFKIKNDHNEALESILKVEVQQYIPLKMNPKIPKEIKIYEQIAENKLIKAYSFQNECNKNIKVVEMMGESIFGYNLPTAYLKKIFEEESLLQESLVNTIFLDSLHETHKSSCLMKIIEDMSKYEVILTSMSEACAEETRFLPSNKRYEFLSSFVPLNLHLNRILVVEEGIQNQMKECLDSISVGAFCARYLKIKNDGLLSMIKDIPGYLDSKSSLVISNRMLRQYVHLMQDILNQLRHIESFITYPNDVKEDLPILQIKIDRFLTFFHHEYLCHIPQETVRRNYQQLIIKIKDTFISHASIATNIKVVHNYIDRLERSLKDMSGGALKNLWSNIFAVLNTESLVVRWRDYLFHENIAFSHALTAAATGISLACNIWSSEQWSQMISCGVPLYFEGILPMHGDENGVVEDMRWVIEKLMNYPVIIKPSVKTPGFNLSQINRIEIFCYSESWKRVPMEIRMKQNVELHLMPYFLNLSLNDQGTTSEKMSTNNSETSSINNNGLSYMKDYYALYEKFNNATTFRTDFIEIQNKLKDLECEIKNNENGNVKILNLCQQISWWWDAIRFTSCTTAKDNTGMAISLEQVRWLKNIGALKVEDFDGILECIRSSGLRRDNCFKNNKINKFVFNTSQILPLPKEYRPPPGTYVSGEN